MLRRGWSSCNDILKPGEKFSFREMIAMVLCRAVCASFFALVILGYLNEIVRPGSNGLCIVGLCNCE
jgi:hypothetical protein